MTKRKSYTYVVVRYTHDPISAEFINVGVVLMDTVAQRPLVRFQRAYSRAKAMFPTLNRDDFIAAISRARQAINASSPKLSSGDLFATQINAEQLVLKALPLDDHGIQAGSMGNGMTLDLDTALDQLFDRFVLKYDGKQKSTRRDDSDIWRPMQSRFKSEQVADLFSEATVVAKSDVQKFEHTWRNGKLHCIQPLSFDLSSADAVREKARNWLGKLAALDDAESDFKAYLVLGEPSNPSLKPAFKQGLELLQKVPAGIDYQIIVESEIDDFTEKFVKTMKEHVLHDE
jgi:Protein of unknown function (DUF3037)